MPRPFSTAETSARVEVAEVMSMMFGKMLVATVAEGIADAPQSFRPARVSSAQRLANTVIRDVKRALKSNGAKFDATSNYFLSTIKKLLARHHGKLRPEALDPTRLDWLSNFELALVEIVFFFYASSPRVRQTYLVAEILLLVIEFAANAPQTFIEKIYTKIAKEIRLVSVDASSSLAEDNIETLNLLFVLQRLGREYELDANSLCIALCIPIDLTSQFPTNFGYFQIVTTLYLCHIDSKYAEIKNAVLHLIVSRFEKSKQWQQCAESTMLILDLMACPSLTADEKQIIAKCALAHFGSNDLNARAQNFVRLAGAQTWFFNWARDIKLSDLLYRKELRTPY